MESPATEHQLAMKSMNERQSTLIDRVSDYGFGISLLPISVASIWGLYYLGAVLAPDPTKAADPNLFAVNWRVVLEVLVTMVLLSILLERGLAPLFESYWFVKVERKRKKRKLGSYRSLIAFYVAVVGCVLWQFDAISIILLRENTTILGAVLSGSIIAGGSKAVTKLFHDVLRVSSLRRESPNEVNEGQLSSPRIKGSEVKKLEAV